MGKTVNLRQKFWLTMAMVSALFVTSLGVAIQTDSASALDVEESPNQANMRLTNGTGTSNGGALPANGKYDIFHVLKNENTSQSLKIETEAYFDTASTAHRITVFDRIIADDRCQTSGSTPVYFIRVTIATQIKPAGTSSVTYNIPSNRVCTGPTNTTSSAASNNNYFFSSYPMPAGFTGALALKDIDTNLYKVKVTIEYNPGVTREDTSSSTKRQQILFKLKTDACNGAAGCERYISATPITSAGAAQARNISTVGRNSEDLGPQAYTNQTFGFGLPCSDNVASIQKLTLYDLDNGNDSRTWDTPERGHGKARFYVQKYVNGNWQDLPASAYTLTGNNSRIVSYNGHTMILPDDGSTINSTVSFRMEPKTRYRVTFGPVWSDNLIGLGLPAPTIFGDLDCNVTLNGTITVTPTTGINPIEVGRTLSVNTSASRTGNTSFPSTYNAVFRVWYDTGNGKYDTGESTACPPLSSQKTQTGTTTIALGSCPNVLSDATRSGGNASAICAQLILTPLDGITQVGAGAPPDGIIRCFQIGKRPHLRALNGDVLAGGVADAIPCRLTVTPIITGNKVTIDGQDYSSYATYGVTSLGIAQNFGSNGIVATNPTANALIFSNRTENSVNGYFYSTNNSTAIPASGRCLTDPFTTLGAKATISGGAPATLNVNSLATPGTTTARYYTSGGTLTLTSSGDIQPDTKIIIYARNANIKINSNIRYSNGPYASATQLPQVVILTNKDIIVDKSVVQLDGIYAAKHDVQTCDVNPRLGTNNCEKPLDVNGSVIAGHILRPYRTFGADRPDYGQPAETFSLRPDTLVGQLPGANDPDVYIRTVSEREIPPRF